jgi:ABC-type multidrug transport system ATPase subunit
MRLRPVEGFMEIQICNCNNIDICKVNIQENRLNIKFAINGTGKSTISRALSASVTDRINGTNSLLELTPFKALGNDTIKPSVTGTDSIHNVKIFDENYVNNFVFLPNELLKGSFDIFIRNEEYIKGMKQTEDLVSELKLILSEDKDLVELIMDFDELSGSFGRETKTGFHGSSALSKAFKGGNTVVNIPEGLEIYKDYIQDKNNYKWIKWQLDGNDFIDLTDNCPYCVTEITKKKATIRKVSEVYEPKAIENLNKIVAVFQRLNKYFTDETKSVIEEFVTNITGYTDEQVSYLREVRDQIDRLKDKFIRAQNIGFSSLKDIDKVVEGLSTYKINPQLYNHLSSDMTLEKVAIVNSQLDNLIDKAGELQGSINNQKNIIEKLVKVYSTQINDFLKNAGFKYRVNLNEDDNGEYRLRLLHNEYEGNIDNVKAHLSFGERNAFAIVLFMYDAIKSQPDIIILDDPISSFDKNKKYAIVDMLFRKECCFKGKTVILFTHDYEPLVDMLLHHSDRFEKPYVVFLENIHGRVIEKEVLRTDVKTYIEINKDNILKDIHPINKLVYLRRFYEISDERGMAYQLISNLLHRRKEPTVKEYLKERKMTEDEQTEGSSEIRKYLPDFDYMKILTIVQNDTELINLYTEATNNYEKLHIYRIIFEDKDELAQPDIIKKFINESFHTENDSIYQLDPSKYQTIPQYVIDECDKYMETIEV